MRRELITHFEPKAPESEMFRNLRTNIQFMNTHKELRTLLITSTMPGEGKSYVSSNLAVTFAQAGKKVILVDCDMRKGRQFSIFGISPRPGISNYLSGVVDQDFQGNADDIENYIQDSEIENLKVLPAGSVPPNPAELLVSEKMRDTINTLREKCDIVILDAPPALIVADSVILARQVDSCVLVTAHNETRIDEAEKVKNAIRNVGGKIAGVVINKIPTSNKKYGNKYYYYYGSYGTYGSEISEETGEDQEKTGFLGKLRDFFTVEPSEKKEKKQKKEHIPARKRILNKRNEQAENSAIFKDNWYNATDEWNASENEIDDMNKYSQEYSEDEFESKKANNQSRRDYEENDYEDGAIENIFSDIKYNLKQ